MRASSILSVVTLALLVMVAPAQAAPSRRTVASLHTRIAQLRAEQQALRAQVAASQATITVLVRQRDQARAQIATLQAQIAAVPAPLDQAVEQIRREVTYSERFLAAHGVTVPHGQLVSEAAMTYVVGHVTAPAYGYMNEILNVRPAPTANGALSTGAGICGHAALTFAAIIKRLGVPVRSVQFYYGQADTHIADETFYDGDWHYYDPTYGAIYVDGGKVLSITDARGRPDGLSLLEHDRTLLWFQVVSLAGMRSLSDLGFQTAPGTRVELGRQPFA